MLRLAVAALSGLFIAAPLMAQGQNCADTAQVHERLAEIYSEVRRFSGFNTGGQFIEMWGNEETGSWTALVTHPNGQSCIVASGVHFEVGTAPAGARL